MKKANTLEASFIEFSTRAKDHLLVRSGLPVSGLTFGIEDASHYCAQNIRIDNGTYIFDLQTPYKLIRDLHLNLPGRHNLLNAVTAFAIAMLYGSPTESLAKALFSFRGVQRRFSYQIKTGDLVYIDDYAHHRNRNRCLTPGSKRNASGKKSIGCFSTTFI